LKELISIHSRHIPKLHIDKDKFIKVLSTDDNKITNLAFIGGCNGNLKAISKICEGMDASKVMNIFSGNICGMKGTSCADQLSLAIKKALDENK